jgi:hypothetical protein
MVKIISSSTDNKDKNINDYINSISIKYENEIKKIEKLEKIDENVVSVPTINCFNDIIKYNYNLNQLKSFAKHYGLKVGGNKKELITRIYTFLNLSSYIIKIQKCFRGNMVRKLVSAYGPGLRDRKLCTNETDFVSMDSLNEIPYNQFFSYKDVDGIIYGFELSSIYNLICKNMNINNINKEITNPYNRQNIPDFVYDNIKKIIRLSKILDIDIELIIEQTTNLSDDKTIELRALALFQNINALGNYSDPSWFLSLNRQNLIKLVRELVDIWNYRLQISDETKRKICPPNGDPFRNLNMASIFTESHLNNVKKLVLELLEKFVNSGIDNDSKSLGAYYVLGALTIVSNQAATTIPWLFQSFAYFQNM